MAFANARIEARPSNVRDAGRVEEVTPGMEREIDASERARAWRESHGEAIDDLAALGFHMRARAVLGRVLAALDAAGVEALVVKGAVVASWLYAREIDRPVRDLDLRVRPRDRARAARVIAAMPKARLLVASRAYGSAVLSVDGVEVDVETTVGPPFVCALGVDAMLARAERTDAGLGFVHRRPELHDHALLLAVNLFKDRLAGLPRWRLRDLERLARLPTFDPAVLAARAADARATTVVHVVARHVADRCGDAAWARVADRITPARPRYAARVLAALRGERRPSPLAWRLEVRASSDSRPRALAAACASALRELEIAIDPLHR
jgi:hypothetical protein